MKTTMVVLIIATSIFTTGCCTVFRPGTEHIHVDSEPPGAKVTMGPYSGVTPYTVAIPRGKSYIMNVEHDGWKQSNVLHRKLDALFFVNILWWPGLIVDLVTGKSIKYDPTIYRFDFTDEYAKQLKGE